MTVTKPPIIDFTNLQKQFADATKATTDYIKNLGRLSKAFISFDKTVGNTTKSVKVVDRSFNLLGVTVKGTAKELIQVGTALSVLSGSFFDLQQRVDLVAAPLKGVVDALGAISDKAKGVQIAEAIGVDTAGIQKLELFRAGLFGNVEALQAFRTTSQTAGIAFTLNLTKLNTILKASKDELRNVGIEARKLSKDLGGAVSATDILAGQYQIASAGFTRAADSRAIAEASGKLATVGFNDFFSTADLVTKSLRAYGLEASKASDIAAKLNAVVEVGITTIPELAAGFGETAVVANAFGISIDQLGAAIATITTQGSSTPEALTGIEALLRTLANQSPQATEALAKLTLNGQRVKFDVATVQAKGLGNALTDVFKAANGNVEVLREIIPESRALQAALALAAQGGALFAQSLEAVSQSSPQKLSDIFGEVQEDPTIKLKAIATKAEEIVGGLSGAYDQLTDSAINSLANFVSVTEAIAQNPVVKVITDNLLGLTDILGKVTGFFAALGGAGLSVLGTLVSLNLTNTLFSKGLGGLVQQGVLLKESVLGIKDFGLAIQTAVGIDTTKSVIISLQKQIEDLKIKSAALQLLPEADQDKEAISNLNNRIADLTNTINKLQEQADKPAKIALDGVKEAAAEVRALQSEIDKLGTDDPKRAELLNKQADAVGRIGEERLKLEEEIRRQQKAGTISRSDAEIRRSEGNAALKSVAKEAKGSSIFDSVIQTTTLGDIKEELEKEKAKGSKADTTRISNLTESLKQINSGTLGTLDSAGKLEKTYQRTFNLGQKAGTVVAKTWDFVTQSFNRSKTEIGGVNQALEFAARSQNINNIGAATGKLLSTIPTLAIGAVKGLRTLGLATATFGANLIGQFINPLTAAIAVFGLFSDLYRKNQEGLAFNQTVIQSLADAELKRTEAIRNTTKALEEQDKVQRLVARGFTEKEAVKQVSRDTKEAELRKAVPNLPADRQRRVQRQLLTGDFRSSQDFLKEEVGRLRDNRLGIGTDNGKAQSETFARNTTTALAGTLGGAGGAVAAALFGGKIGASLGSIFPGLGTLLGAAAGATLGVAFSELIRKFQGDARLEEIKAEASARRRLELERKFRLDEAKTPQERASRLAKVNEGVKLGDALDKSLIGQSGLDDNALQQLTQNADDFVRQRIDFLTTLKDILKSNNDLLNDVDKNLKENQIPEGLFQDSGLTARVNKLLKTTGELSSNDLLQIDADFKGRIDRLQSQKQLADKAVDEFKTTGNNKAAIAQQSQSDALAGQIERLTSIQRELDKKVKISSTQVQNAVRLGQGATASVLADESKSIEVSIEAINKAISSTATDQDINALPNQLQALATSLETVSNLDANKAFETLERLRSVLSGKDIVKLSPQQILGLQNIVTQTSTQLAQRQVTIAESAARRIQGLANAPDSTTARVGGELAAQEELKVLDARIKAQQIAVENARGQAKELATNDLIQLQLDKKTKTIEARVQKEINAADLLLQKEKARLDLTRADLDLKKQIFEQFGLQTEGVDTEIAKNNLEQFRAESKRQRDVLAAQQKAGLEQAQAASSSIASAPIEERRLALPQFDETKYKQSTQAISDRKLELTKEINRKFDEQVLGKTSKLKELEENATSPLAGLASPQLKLKRKNEISNLRTEIQTIEGLRARELAAVEERANGAQFVTNLVNDFNKQTFKSDLKTVIEKNRPKTDTKSAFNAVIGIGRDNAGVTEIQKQQQEEAKRLDAINKKKEQELQFQVDLAEAYNGILKPLERQSQKLIESNNATAQLLGSVQQLNPLYVSQEALLGSIQASAGLQILNAKRTLDVEKQKLDIQEKLLAKNGLLTDETRKQLNDQRAVLDANFKQQVVSIKFEAQQGSIDAFARKLSAGIEQKIKGLDLTRNALGVFADSFEDPESKQAVEARKQAAAIGIDIAVRQAALAEQTLKIEQEKTLNQLRQNDLQLQFLDIQLKIQGTQTKDKDLLDAIASARGSISGLRANIGAEIKNAPERFAEEQKLRRQQSVLDVSSTALNFQKQFGTPEDLKKAQEQFLSVNQLNLNRPTGNTSVGNAVGVLQQRSAEQQQAFSDRFGSGIQQRQNTVQPIRQEADGSITNLPAVTVNINVGSSNATPQDIARVVRTELYNTTKELQRK